MSSGCECLAERWDATLIMGSLSPISHGMSDFGQCRKQNLIQSRLTLSFTLCVTFYRFVTVHVGIASFTVGLSVLPPVFERIMNIKKRVYFYFSLELFLLLFCVSPPPIQQKAFNNIKYELLGVHTCTAYN